MSGVARVPVTRWPGGLSGDDEIVVEEPLEIRVEDHPLAVTMRTPGDDLDLAAGFLWTEGVIDGPDDLIGLDHLPGDPVGNTVVARLAGGVQAHWDAVQRATREIYATSACGICGKASLDRIRLLAPPLPRRVEVGPLLLAGLAAALRSAQPAFARTGGLHGAGLFTLDAGEAEGLALLELAREDVGRHNAVDKVLGARLRADHTPVGDRILVVSGRAGFEIVQKARMAGVPAVAAIGAASSLAVELARDAGMMLVGFLGEDRFVRYT